MHDVLLSSIIIFNHLHINFKNRNKTKAKQRALQKLQFRGEAKKESGLVISQIKEQIKNACNTFKKSVM